MRLEAARGRRTDGSRDPCSVTASEVLAGRITIQRQTTIAAAGQYGRAQSLLASLRGVARACQNSRRSARERGRFSLGMPRTRRLAESPWCDFVEFSNRLIRRGKGAPDLTPTCIEKKNVRAVVTDFEQFEARLVRNGWPAYKNDPQHQANNEEEHLILQNECLEHSPLSRLPRFKSRAFRSISCLLVRRTPSVP